MARPKYTLYLTIVNDIATGFHTQGKTDYNGNKPPAFDLKVTDYPDDFPNKLDKYTIDSSGDVPTFTVRPQYEEWEEYVQNYEPQDENDFPLSYEDWINQ